MNLFVGDRHKVQQGLGHHAAVALGVADYLAGATLRSDGRQQAALTYTAVATGVGALVALLAVPIARPEAFTAPDVLWAMAAGVAIGIALPLLMVGMARGPMAIVAPVTSPISAWAGSPKIEISHFRQISSMNDAIGDAASNPAF